MFSILKNRIIRLNNIKNKSYYNNMTINHIDHSKFRTPKIAPHMEINSPYCIAPWIH